jgi:hypothetical protein
MAKNDKVREELAESRHVETIRLALATVGIAGISLGVAYGIWRGWLYALIMMTIVIVGWLSLYFIARHNSTKRKDKISQLDEEEQKLISERADTGQQEQDRTAPGLIHIWGQLNEDMRHRETIYTQLIVSMFVFVGAAGALIRYIPALRWWVWWSGVAIVIAGWVYVSLIARGQGRSHEAALVVQRRFRLADDIAESLDHYMHERRQRFSSWQARIPLIAVTVGMWIYLGVVVVFSGS